MFHPFNWGWSCKTTLMKFIWILSQIIDAKPLMFPMEIFYLVKKNVYNSGDI